MLTTPPKLDYANRATDANRDPRWMWTSAMVFAIVPAAAATVLLAVSVWRASRAVAVFAMCTAAFSALAWLLAVVLLDGYYHQIAILSGPYREAALRRVRVCRWWLFVGGPLAAAALLAVSAG
jgi:hypothetical protein